MAEINREIGLDKCLERMRSIGEGSDSDEKSAVHNVEGKSLVN